VNLTEYVDSLSARRTMSSSAISPAATTRGLVLCLAAVLGVGVLVSAQVVTSDKGGEDVSGPYEVVPGWPRPLADPQITWGRTSSIWAETPDRVFVISRGWCR
jgi:hypothetical protein